MKKMIRIGMAGTAAFGLAFTAMTATAESLSTRAPVDAEATPEGIASPDVWVCTLPVTAYWATNSGKRAFSIATTSANAGNINLQWIQNGTQHPVISQDMYRLKDGILEHIGMSWLKHGFCALQQNIGGCGNCPGGGGCLSFLQPGCADPYSADLNASTNLLGPRSEVNPSTGVFAWPHSVGSGSVSSAIRSRLQVDINDLDTAMNPGARYFMQGQYVHPQDAGAVPDNNPATSLDNNNASYREVALQNYNYGPSAAVPPIGGTVGMRTIIEGWGDIDPSVQVEHIDLLGTGGGRFFIASRAEELGGGFWSYEYAVFNMNADRAVGSFSVPVGNGVNATSIGFHDVDYHSGEIYDGTDWPGSEGAGAVTWATTSFASNPNANAIRWATMYNFRFIANAAPVQANATVGFFKPGSPSNMTVAVQAPGEGICTGDLNGDGFVDGSDLANLLAQFGGPGSADFDGSGTVNGADLAALLANWGGC